MDIFAIDFSFNELVFVRQALDVVSVAGKDAKFLAALQIKVENELAEIQKMKQEFEDQKIEELQQAITIDQSKARNKKDI
jgi:acid phosphatase family membrane protein YuiD